MCGILGIVASPGRPPRPERASLVRMRDAMSSCGPDGAGLFERRNVAFAHLRLAICDHTGGGQPWLSDDGQCVLVYNGEIYNDIELRRELNALGRRFRSFCDTEVVMEAYREWGVDCVRRFRGMFAFGLYDFEQDRLLLVCDRFGIKPLFLTEVDGDLVFASSIAALVQHPRFSKSSSIPAISH